MAEHRKDVKMNIPMCLAAILFCLTLLSIHFMSGLYARYTTNASGSDSARVITFGDLTLVETGDFYAAEKLRIIPGVDLQKKVTVSFTGSESATYLFVELEPSADWTTTDNRTFAIRSEEKTMMQWSIANDWKHLPTSDGTYVYYRELAPNATVAAADIIADNGKVTVNNQITKDDLKNMKNIVLKVSATVVQAGGFESVQAAWNSVKEQ